MSFWHLGAPAQSLSSCLVYATPLVEGSTPVRDYHSCSSAGGFGDASPAAARGRTGNEFFGTSLAFRRCRCRPDRNPCRGGNQPRPIEGNGFRREVDRQPIQGLDLGAAADSGRGRKSCSERDFLPNCERWG